MAKVYINPWRTVVRVDILGILNGLNPLPKKAEAVLGLIPGGFFINLELDEEIYTLGLFRLDMQEWQFTELIAIGVQSCSELEMQEVQSRVEEFVREQIKFMVVSILRFERYTADVTIYAGGTVCGYGSCKITPNDIAINL